MNQPSLIPAELARKALLLLATRKISPTPDNYTKIYAEISGTTIPKHTEPEKILLGIADHLAQQPKSAPAGIELKKIIKDKNWELCLKKIEAVLPKKTTEQTFPWSNLISELLRQLESTHKGLTVTRKKEGLETVLKRFAAHPDVLFEKLDALMHSWSETPAGSAIDVDPAIIAADESETAPAASIVTAGIQNKSSETLGQFSALLTQSLESALSTQPELTPEVLSLVEKIQAAKTPEQIALLVKLLRQFWIKFEIRTSDKNKANDGLLRLFRLLVDNVGEMVEDEVWLHGQVVTLQEIIAKPVDRRVIADAERSLRDTIINQGLLKKSLSDAKFTLKNLMSTFIERLNEITESTGEYHQKLEGYSHKIGETNHLTDLSHLLNDIMQDTRIIQTSALRSHEELVNTRQQVQKAETEIQNLQQELAQVSELVREDQLTGALNRRGLDAAFQVESSRSDRHQSLLCVALLDIDNFKHLNDTLGHQTGDQALIHLSNVIRNALRPSDSVARYGGEEFILLLPDATIEAAATTVERLQRELTKKYFMHENDRVLVTFSAGVALRAPQESQEEVIGRADKAMYQAKRTGKNRVVKANN